MKTALTLLVCLGLSAAAWGLELPGAGQGHDPLLDGLVDDLAGMDRDYRLLGESCRIELQYWPGVQGGGRRRSAGDDGEPPAGWKWDEGNGWLAPIPGSRVAVAAAVQVPANGTYRVWLRRHVRGNELATVKMEMSGANTGTYLYGAEPLSGEPLRGQQDRLRFRVEELEWLDTMFINPVWIWEYHDIELRPGATTLAFSTELSTPRIGTVFLSRAPGFVPNRSAIRDHNNLDKIYYRFRIPEGARGAREYRIADLGVGFNWRWRPRGFIGQFYWHSSLNALSVNEPGPPVTSWEGRSTIRQGEWSSWVDAAFCSTGAGPWFTLNAGVDGVTEGQLDVQLAWFPDDHAVLTGTQARIYASRAVLALPALLGRIDFPVPDERGSPVWGVVRDEFAARLRTAADMHRDFVAYAEEAVAALGLPDDHPRPRKLRLLTHGNVVAPERESTARALSLLGITETSLPDREQLERLGMRRSLRLAYSVWAYQAGSHDPADPSIADTVRRIVQQDREQSRDPHIEDDMHAVLIGDEIGPVTGAEMINHSSDCRAHFHAWLAGVLREKDETPAYFGVDDLAVLDFLGSKPPRDSSRHARRLYYHSQIYQYVLTADLYRHTMNAVDEFFPNAVTYANFSPASPIIDSPQHMNHADWFSLPRRHGASMAWGSCWANHGGWGYLGLDIVSYYGAWVECAARRHDLSTGFYAVLRMGGADHKIVSLVSRGIDLIDLYDFGPVYNGNDQVNFWSDSPDVYREIARGAYAIGPADTIIAEGRQPPRRVALLYNRTHEIWNGGPYGMQCDRALTFAALTYSQFNPDIVLVEDLVPEELARYAVVIVNGFNLPAVAAAHLREWVAQGGLLIGAAGAGMLDEYDEPTSGMAELFGADQVYVRSSRGRWHPGSLHEHEPIEELSLQESELTPEMRAPVIGSMVVLTPRGGTPVGVFGDGRCAAVINRVGKGRTLLYGFQPGIVFKGDAGGPAGLGNYRFERGALLTRSLFAHMGVPAVTIDAPQVEMALFEHETGLAVTLNNFGWHRHGKDEAMPRAIVTLRTERPVSKVSSSFQGALDWTREGDTIRIAMELPRSVDVIIVR